MNFDESKMYNYVLQCCCSVDDGRSYGYHRHGRYSNDNALHMMHENERLADDDGRRDEVSACTEMMIEAIEAIIAY